MRRPVRGQRVGHPRVGNERAGVTPPPAIPNETEADARRLAVILARAADAKKAEDVRVLQVGDVLAIAEYFVVCSASNRRLVKTVADEIEEVARVEAGRKPLRVEGAGEQQWVLIDFGDVVAHVFTDEVRAYYEIERLYRDVPSVDWSA